MNRGTQKEINITLGGMVRIVEQCDNEDSRLETNNILELFSFVLGQCIEDYNYRCHDVVYDKTEGYDTFNNLDCSSQDVSDTMSMIKQFFIDGDVEKVLRKVSSIIENYGWEIVL